VARRGDRRALRALRLAEASLGVVTIGVVWGLYAAYETGMQQRWLCSGECNIRVDLLLIYPFLLLASGAAAWSLRRGRQAPGNEEEVDRRR
jgi:hypothetical protein